LKEKIAGINSIMEALRGGRKIHHIYIQEGRKGKRIDELTALAEKRGVHIQYTEKLKLDKFYQIGNHQGIVAQVDAYQCAEVEEALEQAALKGEEPFLLVLDGIEDPQNLGSIIRTAECAGVHGVILPRHHATEVTDAVVRASAGAVEHMKVIRETNLVNTLKQLKQKGFWIIGADMSGEKSYFSQVLPRPAVLVIGSEGKGVRRLVRETCDMVVSIPMKGQTSSLNASVAAALLIYELVRQKTEDLPENNPL